MRLSLSDPPLALDTYARRMRPLDRLGLAVPVEPAITWYGPARVPAGWPGSEAAVQAMTGLMEVNGRDRNQPRRFGIEVASVAAGIVAAQGALAAAIARLRGGIVTEVETSVLQAGLLLLSNYVVVATALGDAVPGAPLPAPGPPFPSADGHWFEIDTFDPDAWKAFWTALGAGDAELGRGWTVFQWRYERATCSLPPGLHEAAARFPLAELRRVAAANEISLVPLRDADTVLADGLEPAAHPAVRRVGTRWSPPARTVPPEAGRPLAGIRVVEATSRIQGPLAGMLLRMLGADVVRVQPPDGDYGRAALCLHRGKDTVALDLASSPGRAALVDLVAGADVFLHNWRPGKAAEWGLDVDDLVALRPGLVYAHASGWGDRPEAGRLMGTDFLVQAHTALGHGLHPDGEPPFPSRVVLCDLFGGLVMAEGILTALYRRALDGAVAGGAWEVRSSLLAGAMALQAHVFEALRAGKEDGRRHGRPMWGVLDRPVPTSDGLLAVTVDDDDRFRRLCEACGVDAAGASRTAAEPRLAACLAERTAVAWADALPRAGVPAAVVRDDVVTATEDPRLSHLFEPVGAGGLAPRSPWSFR